MASRWTSLSLVSCLICVTPVLAQRSSIPSLEYQASFVAYCNGEYRTAFNNFKSAAVGAVRSTDGLRWVDSICYFTMMGECLQKMGQNAQALEQYDAALRIAVAHNGWMLRVEFPEMVNASGSMVRNSITWGQSQRNTRLANVPDNMLSLQGRTDNKDVLERGGVVAPPEYYSINAKEIARCTSLAIWRRHQLMGPACQYSPLTQELVAAFAARPARQNHWAQAWISSHLGLAHSAMGKPDKAVEELNKSLVIGGNFDHDLTAIGLLELGRLTLEKGQNKAASALLLEASFAAAAFEQFDLMEESLRLGLTAHITSGQKGVYPPLAPAAMWAKRYDARSLQAELLQMAADNAAALGDGGQAIRLLGQSRQCVGRAEMLAGPFGARLSYLSALTDFQRGSGRTGASSLQQAMAAQQGFSRRLFQVQLAATFNASGVISQRDADLLFTNVLREPTAQDWVSDPFDTLTTVVSPPLAPLQSWLRLAMLRKDQEKALWIAEQIRRYRFFGTLPLGGRLLAFRWLLESPQAELGQVATLQRQDLLARFPAYGDLSKRAAGLRQQLIGIPLVPEDPDQLKQQAKLLEDLAGVSAAQEAFLNGLVLRREPSEFVFPPLKTLEEIQAAMPDDQLILSYAAQGRSYIGFAIAKKQYLAWEIPASKLNRDVSLLLEQIGVTQRRQGVTAEMLQDQSWKATSTEVLNTLTNNDGAAMWDRYKELVVIPDGMLWYVPFEATQVAGEEQQVPLLSRVKVRCVPTASLANGSGGGRMRDARTAVVQGKMYPGQDLEVTAEAYDAIESSLPLSGRFGDRLPGPSNLVASMCDRAIVLQDLEVSTSGPYAWSPLRLERDGAAGKLDSWFALPWQSPREVVYPCFHTAADNGLRRGGDGDELFLGLCGLMACGTRTVLISRWPVNGQSTLDLVREYAQELPYTAPADAWRRSVQLAEGTFVDPALEPRVDASGGLGSVTLGHPFFWAGFLLVDLGVPAPRAVAP